MAINARYLLAEIVSRVSGLCMTRIFDDKLYARKGATQRARRDETKKLTF